MPGFLRNFRFDAFSFWLGFLVASLAWYFLRSLRGYWPQIRTWIKDRIETIQRSRVSGLEDRLRKETLRQAQGMHLAWSLCPLDELLVEPRLIPPPSAADPGELAGPDQLASSIISYLPDWPELPTRAGIGSATLAEVLQGGVPIALVGQPGSGRSVTLAHLASSLARRTLPNALLADHFPILVHAADLILPKPGEDPLQPIVSLVNRLAPVYLLPQVQGFLRTTFLSGRAVVLLDGLDELPPAQLKEFSTYLRTLLNEFSGIKLAAAAGLDYLDGLLDLGFIPVAMAGWTETDYAAFLKKWELLWMNTILPEVLRQKPADGTDPLLLNYWLLGERGLSTPLDFTLKTWAAYAGDPRGPTSGDAVEAFLRRVTPDPRSRTALEKLAAQMVLGENPTISRGKAGALVAEFEPAPVGEKPTEADSSKPAPAVDPGGKRPAVIQRIIPGLVENGLLVERSDDRLSFAHPVFLGRLAARPLANSGSLPALLAQRTWSGRSLTFSSLAGQDALGNILNVLLQDDEEPLFRGTFTASRWLKDAPPNVSWRPNLMRRLADILQRSSIPMAARQRALAGLLLADDPSTRVLFRQMISSASWATRLLGTLGLGANGDTKTVQELGNLLGDPEKIVRYAACTGLGMQLPARPALDMLGQALHKGDEEVRRAAAEELARFPVVGHPVLKQYSTSEDILVRRAVVYGLTQINQPWAVDILEKMRIEDGQWVVRNAAGQAVEALQHRSRRAPRPLLEPSQSPWLITFASKLGTGIRPGDTATDLLIQALKAGTDDERIAALKYLRRLDDPEITMLITKSVYLDSEPVREAAYEALWYLTLRGATVLSPRQFGLA